ncbi:SPOCS domain-containing protein [Acetivibrio sp. MSJd-27]|uniref:DUF3794 and LysM peptidoglycan-binding domain-containing protein n=1 Tax=Acetivibrio sp. MSJd-27 TaxID=2841523 RepID=UPI001C116F04|nr:SPOCS domain-containing protein [Acetivibrio sp. MSJd-27]MBU5449707.1 DUF3794 domain-containing protein [Acetivibrio sp. MSJd-27]
MSAVISSESMKTSKTIAVDSNNVICEWDIIVPDSKPDIGSVLKTDTYADITSCEVMQDRAVVNGVLKLNILYISAEEESPSVKSIETSQNFSHVMELKGLRQNMDLALDASVSSSSTNVINSRKINFASTISLDACVQDQSEMEFVCEMEDENIQTLSKELKTYKTVCEGQNEIVLREDLEVPMGKPSISDILKVDVKLANKEVKPINNKIVVKGELSVATLYNGDIEDTGLQYMEHEIPFTEILDVEGMQENCECDTDFVVADLQYFAQEDEEGQKRQLCLETKLKLSTKSYENVTFHAIVDAYSTKYEMEIEKTDYSIDEIVGDINTQLLNKSDVHFDDIPSISKIYSFNANPKIDAISVTNGNIRIEGTVQTDILYTSANAEKPIYSVSKEVPFVNNLPCDDAKAGTECEAKIDLIHSGYNITSDYDIELRTTLGFRARLKNTSKNNLIKSVSIDEEKALVKKRPSIVIYFCSENENLWDIAKKYKTTVGDIIEANGLSGDKAVVSGIQLLIP